VHLLAASTGPDASAVELLPRAFERQASERPHDVALASATEEWTYGELAVRCDAYAAELAARGVATETVVAVVLERSPELVAALLGVLKAGGAYVAIAPTTPSRRLATLLHEVEPKVVVADGALEAADGRPLLAPSDVAPSSGSAPARSISPRALAYLAFTSGSTGRPKAVAVEHGAIATYLEHAYAAYAPIGPGSVVLQVVPPAFDGSLRDMIGPLTRGARVVLLQDGAVRDPEAVRAALSRFRVTDVLGAVPSLLGAWLDSGLPPADTCVERTLVAGESLLPLRRRYGARLGRFGEIVNHYGPTECTVISVYARRAELEERSDDVVGVPLPGVCIHLLDRGGEPVRPGEEGEVWIGGIGVARGYYRRPDLTAAGFRPDPFCGGGRRMYGTGDLGRLLDDGSLALRGRLDRQLKIRGNRVEPGEIEATLAEHPAVRAAAVLPQRTPEHVSLVAYVAADARPELEHELRRLAADTLPEYMRPARVVRLDALPLTPNGKVDVQALLDLSAPPARARAAPTTELERRIARIYEDVLGLAAVAADGDFLELGGNSLLAMHVLSRVRSETGVGLTFDAFFAAPTVAAIAERVAAESGADADRRSPAEPTTARL
jgi:amino acid adenylation domain-containing protein